jgi:cytochrome P450
VGKFDINNVTTNTAAFIPFSFGPANCAGKNLALLELRTVISYIIRRFDLMFVEGYDVSRWDKEGEDYFVFQTGGLPIKLTQRD